MGRNLSTVPFVQEGQPVSAAWANQLVRELRNQPAYVAQMQIPKPPSSKPPCAFGYVYSSSGNTYLQGGIIIGGETNYVNDPIEIADTLEDNDYIYLEVMFTANSGDGILLGGVKAIQSITVSDGVIIPNNKLPKMNDPRGIIYIALGTYLNNKFNPFGCGNFILTHCPGSISYARDIYE